MTSLFEKITSPVMRDINVKWSDTQTVEQYPQKISDLYAGQPLTVIVKSTKPLNNVDVTGKLLNTPWEKSLNLTTSANTQTKNLDAVWARQKIADLMDKLRTGERDKEQVKPEVIKLGITHNIVSKYTSFIAVEEKRSRPADRVAKHNSVPNLMPKGSTMPAPKTATPATLLSLLGGFMILLSQLLKHGKEIRSRVVRLIALRKKTSTQTQV